MTDKELSKLRRLELLEILFELRKQLDAAVQENKELCAELEQLRRGMAHRTELMVRRLYEERFGEFIDNEQSEEAEETGLSQEADRALEEKADE